jgi:DNA modification methylase
MNYQSFLNNKDIIDKQSGFEPVSLNPKLYDFQLALVRWACKRGRAAIFADCGLGKTPMQLEWANQVHNFTGQPVLILAPLAVSKQTQREGEKFNIDVQICESQDDVINGVNITNYEKLHKFDAGSFVGIVLDESSILKSYTGKFRNYIIESFQKTPYKLACTATPAPNDFIELGNHSEFLNVLSRSEMLSLFFINDTANVGTWRLKGHGEEKFWKWLCSWAVMLSKPSELGFDDSGFILPELNIIEHVIEFGKPLEGCLFPQKAETLSERRQARRESIDEKIEIVLQLISNCGMVNKNNGEEPCQKTQNTLRSITKEIKIKRLRPPLNTNNNTAMNARNTCADITVKTNQNGQDEQEIKEIDITLQDENNIKQTSNTEKNKNVLPVAELKNNAGDSLCHNMDSQTMITQECCKNKTESVPYVGQKAEIKPENICMLTTAINQESSEDCCAATVTTCSEKLKTILKSSKRQFLIWVDLNNEQDDLESTLKDNCFSVRGSQDDPEKERQITGWINNDRPVMISKAKIMGFGLNLQQCSDVIFFGLSDSYEAFYQAIRRCWRFGQKSKVNCHIITTDIEGNIVENIKRKEADAQRMRKEMIEHMQDITKSELHEKSVSSFDYRTDVFKNHRYELHLGDNIDLIKEVKDDSIGFSIFSPPFASLFTYTNSIRDMGNCRDKEDFLNHFKFLVTELHRVMMPGRLIAIHCMNLPMTITHDGVMGMHDFRGDIIRLFQGEKFIFHSEICIWKDPLVQAVRTKVLSLAHKQVCKDSSRCGTGIPDYIVVMRKEGDNPKPIERKNGFTEYIGEREFTNTNFNEDQRKNKLSHEIWQRYASPVWFDIRQTRVLSTDIARDEKDEKHVCPLQLDTIERCMELWSARGDVVLDPFSGIGSTVYSAVSMGRYGIGLELKESYWKQSIKNMQFLENKEKQGDLLSVCN